LINNSLKRVHAIINPLPVSRTAAI